MLCNHPEASTLGEVRCVRVTVSRRKFQFVDLAAGVPYTVHVGATGFCL